MPFKRLGFPPKSDEQVNQAVPKPVSQAPPTPMPIEPAPSEPAAACTLGFEVNTVDKTYRTILHGNCGDEIDKLNNLPLMTRRNLVKHMHTDDPELRRKLAEVKRRKSPIH